ncbi:hypothetical protein CFP71_41015 [Amycolatopsis thailandensis]|uniref:Uncharacterized protein n=1 Tax=Amycolatopsis thailandensis TaxID=589330 RepID=A0A229RBJ4_9PSEU|nr:hypothetical protein [Amycolatopsis thailandensis]OXM44017.1 hypothetical protein CFP71_41015 [Amycolatopsis thailandensis]
MLTATKTSSLGHEYILTRDDSELGTLSLRKGRVGARIDFGDAEYRVRRHRLSGVHELLAPDGTVLAATGRVGRSWALSVSGRDFEFRRTAEADREYTMLGRGGATAGTVSRNGSAVSCDLPGLTSESQIFVLVVVLLRRRRKRTAAAVRGGLLSGG